VSLSYSIEIEKGLFTFDYEWRALVMKDGEVVNCFLGRDAVTVSEEAHTAVAWHESREVLHSVKS
jgi:hypothetical protein